MTKAQRKYLIELAKGDEVFNRNPNPASDVLVVHGWASRCDGTINGKRAYIYSITAEGRKAVRDEAE